MRTKKKKKFQFNKRANTYIVFVNYYRDVFRPRNPNCRFTGMAEVYVYSSVIFQEENNNSTDNNTNILLSQKHKKANCAYIHACVH